MRVVLNDKSLESYKLFLQIKSLPKYRIVGHVAEFPDEYASRLGMTPPEQPEGVYMPSPAMFDYQRDISGMAVRKKKFAVFLEPGRGKTLILLDYARHVASVLPSNKCVLIVSPLMVIRQTLQEAKRFYGDSLPIQQVPARELGAWMERGEARVGITNYEAIHDGIEAGACGCLILDESSLTKSHYGKWGQRLIELGRGLDWKLCLTGTPAPNDRIEYANHAVFLDQFPTVNAFLARYFVNRGQTDNRWEIKAHALRPFYAGLSHWSIFVSDPATYGWKDGGESLPPIHVHIHDVPMTDQQKSMVHRAGGDMYGTPGGITSRAKLSQLAKGRFEGANLKSCKPEYIRDLVAGWKGESTLIWCIYDEEQKSIDKMFPGCASMYGKTKAEQREQMIDGFRAGEIPVLVSKDKILGFGLNLQVATRQVFSGLQDSYEKFVQCVKRSNRVGSTRDLNVHIPVTEIERPMVDTVLVKAKRVQADNEEQEAMFKESWVRPC